MQDEMLQLIAKDLGIEALSSEQQKQIVGQFGIVALKAATITIVEKLPEGKREEFATLAESGDAGKLQEFLNANLPEHEEVAKQAVAAEAVRFKAWRAAAG